MRFLREMTAVFLLAVLGCSAATHSPVEEQPMRPPPQINAPAIEPAKEISSSAQSVGFERGIATYYSDTFTKRKTASGERYQPSLCTAAHRTHPFGTLLDVQNPRTKQTVTVRVNDRGPFGKGRIIDLSKRAAKTLQIIGDGTAEVIVTRSTLKKETCG